MSTRLSLPQALRLRRMLICVTLLCTITCQILLQTYEVMSPRDLSLDQVVPHAISTHELQGDSRRAPVKRFSSKSIPEVPLERSRDELASETHSMVSHHPMEEQKEGKETDTTQWSRQLQRQQPKETTAGDEQKREKETAQLKGQHQSVDKEENRSNKTELKKRTPPPRIAEPPDSDLLDPIPISQSREDGEESFSACILIMDENHRLPEWLAYNFFALKLRYLVVAVDPHSATSPSAVLHKWRAYMTIIEWTDQDFTTKNLTRDDGDDNETKNRKHNTRQEDFNRQCTTHLRQHNRTWTAYYDVDEFLTINGDHVRNVETLARQPNHIMDILVGLSKNESMPFPVHEKWRDHFTNSACIEICRAMYGTVESNLADVQKGVPKFLDPCRFDTLHYRCRSQDRYYGVELVKSFIDVSRLTPDDYQSLGNAHSPFKSICKNPWLEYSEWPLGIHHYVGSWESYNFRQDVRKGFLKTYDIWKEKALKNYGFDDEARSWIGGFVDFVGVDTAKYLLEGAGILSNMTVAPNNNDTTATS